MVCLYRIAFCPDTIIKQHIFVCLNKHFFQACTNAVEAPPPPQFTDCCGGQVLRSLSWLCLSVGGQFLAWQPGSTGNLMVLRATLNPGSVGFRFLCASMLFSRVFFFFPSPGRLCLTVVFFEVSFSLFLVHSLTCPKSFHFYCSFKN